MEPCLCDSVIKKKQQQQQKQNNDLYSDIQGPISFKLGMMIKTPKFWC